MAKITNMPVEILDLIFKFLCRACKGPIDGLKRGFNDDYDLICLLSRIFGKPNPPPPPPRSPIIYEPHELKWIDAGENPRNPAKFPFNVANVCTLWRDVVLKSSENWTTLGFDLAKDPEPLLGAFAASSDLAFSVIIFTTANPDNKDAKMREHVRVRSIVQHLQPHVRRCTSIIFETIYASSLPSPITILACSPPELEVLKLDYQIYDLPLCYEGTSLHTTSPPPITPRLLEMSMNGSAFMDLLHLGRPWLVAHKANNMSRYGLELQLRDFQFPAPDDIISREYTFANFLFLLDHLEPCKQLYLENFSSAHRPHNRIGAPGLDDFSDHQLYELILKNVSKDLITELFQRTIKCSIIEFRQCFIPPLPCPFEARYITVEDPLVLNLSSSEDDSLYNVFSSWQNRQAGEGSFEVKACPAFDDTFIHWLCDDRGDGECEALHMQALEIVDCTNFTVGAIKRLVETLRPSSHVPDESEYRLGSLTVTGYISALRSEDQEWFRTHHKDLQLRWYV